MNNRLFAILIVFSLAVAGGGCTLFGEKPQKEVAKKPPKEEAQKPGREIVLPRQTGSNFERRIIVDDEGTVPEKKEPVEAKPPAKKKAKAERTEPEQAEPELTEPTKPKKPAEPKPAATPPDRFR